VEKDTGRRAAKFERTESLAPGETRTITLEVPVKDPRLWWPNGMGAQDLYLLDARVSEGAALSESVRVQFGIRELELVANENVDAFVKSMKEHTGSVYHLGNAVGSYPWTFEVNGRKMFAKGGNWIPVDQLLRLDRDRYDRLLRLARDAHFNLLRVWGGGLYETDDFYELCDEYGLLAWQEFLSNRSFSKIDRASFLDGANSAVLRLRNHPSLTFWCGGNEFDPDDAGSKAVIDALAELLARLDPQREFHRASPYMGDDHYWGVWHLKEPYTAYRVVRPFRSEAGVNTFPVLEDYLKFTPEELRWPADPTWIEFHGEYNTRFHHLTKLRRYADEFGAPTSIADFITKSQLYQALADSFNLEFCRANKFSNSGLLVWQYDDIWPAISWSMVDWYGTPKPSYYFFKRAARPVHVSADYEKYLWKAGETFAADIHLLNDTPAPVRGDTWRARILDVRGTPLAEASGPAAVEADRSAKVGRIELPLAPEMAGRSVLVLVELMDSKGAKVSDAAYPIAVSASGDLDSYENIFSELSAMPAVALDVQAVPAARRDAAGAAEATLRLTNPAAALAYFVRVRLVEESATLRSWYGDNYVSLAPGETKNVEVAVEAHAPGTVPATLTFEVSGWNAPPRTVAVAISR
jgi:beta-mannosidase